MPRRTSSAAYRIAFTTSAAFAAAIVMLGIAVYFAADARFRAELDARIADESAGIVRAFHDRDLEDLHEAISRREAASSVNGFSYALFDRQHGGRRVWGSMRTAMPAAGFNDIVMDDENEGADPARALSTDLPGELRLVVALDPEELERLDRTILELFAAAFLLVVVLGVGGALLLGGYLHGRLSRISSTAQAIVAGDLDQRIPVSPRRDEFDDLALALNAMLDRIAHLLDNLRQVSSDVAHDLRTPLARLRGRLEAALDGPRDAAAYRAGLKQGLAQSDDLLALFAAILRISEIEEGAVRRMFAMVDISALARDLGESYAPAVADGGRALRCAIAPGLTLNGDRELLAQALINLLDNAQHHTPPGSRIDLSAAMNAGSVALVVADDGLGVAAADRLRIVRRFARLDASRGTPGHGLGLNLVAAITAAHGGTLSIDDNAPGLRVTMTLPALAA